MRNLILFVTLAATVGLAGATDPELFTEPFHQSPVRGEPGDLLLIAGAGFEDGGDVVYQLYQGDPAPPTSVPPESTAQDGILEILLVTEDNLTVRLASEMLAGEIYELWVRNPGGIWAGPVLINDARPLWVTPAKGYYSQSFAGLPRELKVVGRNLQSLPGSSTRVRLSEENGAATYTLTAMDDAIPDTAIEKFVARLALPVKMVPGLYDVAVDKGDGRWIPMTGQQYEVMPNPSRPPQFRVRSYGCKANDSRDDTACIVSAINDAAGNGGEVFFGKGTWELKDSSQVTHGIIVEQGVSLRGDGTNRTRIERGAEWAESAVFILMGQNKVSDIHFDDATTYALDDHTSQDRMFQTGRSYLQSQPGDPEVIEDLIFTGNKFTNSYYAIGDADYPLRNVYVVGNEFQAFRDAITFGGNRFRKTIKYDVRDTVIAHNTFYPGDFVAPDFNGGQGAIVSQIGGATRLDLSENLTDGRVNGGWRAGHFWHMNGNHEMVLISENSAYCTGDKAGDGEAIAFDENANVAGFEFALRARAATTDSVTVEGSWYEPTEDYYAEHWVQIGDGRGIGQVRKIDQIDENDGLITLTVEPPWDVAPDTTSLVTVSRNYWQIYVVDNLIDVRTEVNGMPLCGEPPEDDESSGSIIFHGPSSDSVAESNLQYGTEGIGLNGIYDSYDRATCENPAVRKCSRVNFSYFNEVRDNLIDGEYDFQSPSSYSGIHVDWGSAPEFCGPVLHYGVSIGRNTVRHADARRGGGIAVQWGWYRGQSTYPLRNLLIFGNTIDDIQRLTGGDCGSDDEWAGIGIHVVEDPHGGDPRRVVWDVMLDGNAVTNVCDDVVDQSCSSIDLTCARECEVPCPTVSSCSLPNCEPTTTEVMATDTGNRVCYDAVGDAEICPVDLTWNVVEYYCVKAACCFEMPACLCFNGPCGTGDHLECR